MEITVELKGYLARYAPPGARDGRFGLVIKSGATVKDVLKQISLAEQYTGLVLINGQKGKKADRLQQGDVVTIFPLVAGG
ncbi:MAG TPA: MoaD/ThiS family protein [Desulfotomaculum sp.]|nr:MoaD/ThiS family protein [Desulfotomaculum sp.]